jgi:hypothetical protein
MMKTSVKNLKAKILAEMRRGDDPWMDQRMNENEKTFAKALRIIADSDETMSREELIEIARDALSSSGW